MPSDNNLKAKTTMTAILLIAALLCAMSCRECPTEPDYSISFSTDFVGASVVRFQLCISDSGDVRDFGIKRDGILIIEGQLSGKDTLITDATAEPATSYQYQGVVYRDGNVSDYSEKIDVTTLDTTSHEVEWTTYRYGYLGSYLRDVCIISEDDIWAVGNIETYSGPYNAVHWNGAEWELKRINPMSLSGPYSSCITDICATTANEIWAVYGIPMYGDGNNWVEYHLYNMGYNLSGVLFQCWGPSSDNMYFAGQNGCLVHYCDSIWTVIETNTNRTVYDIYGLSADLVYMVGSDQDDWSSNFIIYENGVINNLDFPDTCMQAVYATAWNDVYLAGQGLLYYDGRKINDWPWPAGLPKNLLQAVRGNGPNDIFLAGHFGTVIHYNGKTWKYYNILNNANVLLGAVAVKDDVIIVVGDYGQQANIYHGVRN